MDDEWQMEIASDKTDDNMIRGKQGVEIICTVTNSGVLSSDGVAKPTLPPKGLIIIMNVIKIKIYHLLTKAQGMENGLNCEHYEVLHRRLDDLSVSYLCVAVVEKVISILFLILFRRREKRVYWFLFLLS